MPHHLIVFLQVVFLCYFILINLFYLILFLLSSVGIFLYHRKYGNITFYEIRKSNIAPPISILVPGYNESKTIVSCVQALLVLSYPDYEIILINDGSTDGTLETMQRAFKLKKTARVYHRTLPTNNVRGIYKSSVFPNRVVVDKENGGKADALNCGINVSQYPLFCTIDADSLLERDSLLRVVQPFLGNYFKTIASGGMVRVGNGCTVSNGMVTKIELAKEWLPNFQVIEYLRAFLSGRMGFSVMNSLLILSGAFSLFKKEAVIQAGGFRARTVGEDMELIVQMHQTFREKRKPYLISFIPDPVCWTEVPTRFSELMRQRSRWHQGLGETLFRHWKMLLNPRFGLIGLVVMPYFLFVEFFSPFFEFFGYGFFTFLLILRPDSWQLPAAFFILAVLFGILLSLAAVLLEEFTLHRYPKMENFLKLWAATFLENFGYHQMTVLWRIKGIWGLIKGERSWGFLERSGLEKRPGTVIK